MHEVVMHFDVLFLSMEDGVLSELDAVELDPPTTPLDSIPGGIHCVLG